MSFIEKFGYILSEIPVLFFVIWFAIRWVQLRRRSRHEPIYNSKLERGMLFRTSEYRPRNWEFYPRFFIAVIAVAFIGTVEFIILASFGAAILSVAFILTSTAIVRQLFF